MGFRNLSFQTFVWNISWHPETCQENLLAVSICDFFNSQSQKLCIMTVQSQQEPILNGPSKIQSLTRNSPKQMLFSIVNANTEHISPREELTKPQSYRLAIHLNNIQAHNCTHLNKAWLRMIQRNCIQVCINLSKNTNMYPLTDRHSEYE